MLKRLVVLLLFVQISFGQTKEGLELCILYKNSFSAFTTEKEANEALDKILNVIGASKNFTLIPCDDINNALAVTFKGDRFILFDGKFMRDITQLTNSWANMFILAHEVGHHINGHTRDFLLATVLDDQSLEDRRKEELEADEFAAFVVSKLGASFAQIEETIKLIASNKNDLYSTHPSYDKRIAAVKRGFDKAYSGSSSSDSNVYSTNEYNTKRDDIDETIPNLKNPRDPALGNYGSWRTIKSFTLERLLEGDPNDPFIKNSKMARNPVKTTRAQTRGKSLSPYGSKNVELKVTTEYYVKNYNQIKANNKYDHFYIPKMLFEVQLNNWEDAPKVMDYVGWDSGYVRDQYIRKYRQNPERYAYVSENGIYATFEYIIDEKFSGQFVTKIGWYEQTTLSGTITKVRAPRPSQLNGYYYKSQQKELYEFIERLKSGKKLYLRFGKLFKWRGWKNGKEGVFDTSDTIRSYNLTPNGEDIPRYTYEFDLTGSSKAISF